MSFRKEKFDIDRISRLSKSTDYFENVERLIDTSVLKAIYDDYNTCSMESWRIRKMRS